MLIVSFLRRYSSNIGNASAAGFQKDIGLSVPKYEYNVALMLFYIAYVAVEIPSNLVMKKIGSIWLAIVSFRFSSFFFFLIASSSSQSVHQPAISSY